MPRVLSLLVILVSLNVPRVSWGTERSTQAGPVPGKAPKFVVLDGVVQPAGMLRLELALHPG